MRCVEDRYIEYQLTEKLRQLRLEAGLSQHEIGNRMDLYQSTVSDWEIGKFFPASLGRWRDWAHAIPGVHLELNLVDIHGERFEF